MMKRILVASALAGMLAVAVVFGATALTSAQARVVRGTVIFADTGRPAVGAVVNLIQVDRKHGQFRTAIADASGSFSLPLGGEGRWTLVARAAGYGFDLVNTPAAARRIALRKGGMVAGFVSGPVGTTVSGIRLSIAYRRDSLPDFVPVEVHRGRVYTDASGMFALTDVRPDTPFVVQGLRNGTVIAESDELSLESGAIRNVDLRLESALSIRTQVVDEQGVPVGDAVVRFWGSRASDSLFQTTRTRMLTAKTDATGHFRIDGSASNGTLHVDKAGFTRHMELVRAGAVPSALTLRHVQ